MTQFGIGMMLPLALLQLGATPGLLFGVGLVLIVLGVLQWVVDQPGDVC